MRRVIVMALAGALGGACSMNEPTYFPASAAVEIGAGAMGEPFATIELPFRPPRENELQTLRDESQRRGFTVPWLDTSNVALSLLYTIRNLGDAETSAFVEVDGASEFASYDTVALRAAVAMDPDAEDEEVLPLLRTTPVRLAPGAHVTGTLREDDFEEAALDLDALGRFGAAPPVVLLNDSRLDRVGLAMLPAEHVRPALFRVRVALIGAGHLRLEVMVRVRDEAGQLLLKPGDTFTPSPAGYTRPMPMPMP